jgi:DNA recombination protein RmuC
MQIALLIVGLVIGAAAAALAFRGQITALRGQLARERESGEEKVALIRRESEAWEKRFEDLSAKALRENTESFFELARAKLEPIDAKLKTFDEHTRALELERKAAYTKLTTEVEALRETQHQLRAETSSLVTALRAPHVSGRWGEMQLRRAVEAAGMLERCDFQTQVTVQGEDGRLRPDLVVNLPGGRSVVVDAKVSVATLVDALDDRLTEDARTLKLKDFSRQVRDHLTKLSAKSYWQQFTPAPDFVVMFLPGESFYREAMRLDPELLDLDRRVIVASPTILITLLRAVAVGWREEKIAESARAISELGRELYERLAVMGDHFSALGDKLDGAVQAYNKTVGSFEKRVLVTARKFPEHGITTEKRIEELDPVDKSTQQPQTIELPTRAAADAA